MSTPLHRIRRFLLPTALTIACLGGAAAGGIRPAAPDEASAQVTPLRPSSCSNTECEGTAYCRYVAGISCKYEDRSTCVNRGC